MSIEVGFQQLGAARSVVHTDVFELARSVRLPELEIERLHSGGLQRIPCAAKSLAAMLDESLDELHTKGWMPEQCRAVFVTHSLELPTAVMHEVTRTLGNYCRRLLMGAVFVSGRPCSVIHAGIHLSTALARQLQPTESVLLIGADVAGTDEDRFFFGSAMGDAAVAISIGYQPAAGSVLSVATSSHVVASRGAASHPDAIAKFRTENPLAIRAVISTALERARLTWENLDFIIPHTPYTQIWDTTSVIARFPREKILDRFISNTGHLNSNDVIVHYAEAWAKGDVTAGDIVALVSPGFGGSRGCTIVRCQAPPTSATTAGER